MPKTYSYSIVHYGLHYLPYALRSVAPFVDKQYVLYTPHPSHGHSSDLIPIETRDEIMASIPANEWGKLVWIDTDNFWDEGPQRDYAVKTLINDGAEIIINLDYDEIHSPDVLEKTLKEVWDKNNARNHLCNMIHFWRSFSYCCEDDGWPVRILDTRHRTGVNYISPDEIGKILHFGYAVTNQVMKYKWTLHGHKDEMRPNWFEECWDVWPPPNNVHPTNGLKQNGEGWWNPKPYDKNLLPEVLHSHPYFNVGKIE